MLDNGAFTPPGDTATGHIYETFSSHSEWHFPYLHQPPVGCFLAHDRLLPMLRLQCNGVLMPVINCSATNPTKPNRMCALARDKGP